VTSANPTRQWCVEAAELLRDSAVRAARLATAVTIDWLDPDGRAWAERIDALRRCLDETAHEADDLARRLPPTVSAAGYGPRLGDTSGYRVDEAHGVQIAQLPDPP